jgi:hypothetical protein
MLSPQIYQKQHTSISNKHIMMVITLSVFCSIVAFSINAFYYHYPGNAYFSFHTLWIASSLFLIYNGFCILLGKHHHVTLKSLEILYFFFITSLILLGCNAVQYTPFQPIDNHILTWGEWMHIDLAKLVHWSRAHPRLYHGMELMYDSLTLQMTYIPLILIALGRFERVRDYYFLLLLTALIGYSFYYFFPTTAPASMIESPDFSEAQRATGLKFNQIHQYINPTTVEGGLIAFPSFHVIWAWLCAWLVRDWVWAFRALLLFNTGIAISCVLLGWHYVLDLIASIALISAVHYIYPYFRHPQSSSPV